MGIVTGAGSYPASGKGNKAAQVGEKEKKHNKLLDLPEFGTGILFVYAVARVAIFVSSPAFTPFSVFFPSSLSFLKLPCCPDFLISLLSISFCQVAVVYTLFAFLIFFVLLYAHFILSLFSAHFLSWPHLKLPCTSEASICFVTLPVFTTILSSVPFAVRWLCTIFLTSFSLVAYLGLLLWHHNLTWFQHYLSLMLYLLLDVIGAEFTTFDIHTAF